MTELQLICILYIRACESSFVGYIMLCINQIDLAIEVYILMIISLLKQFELHSLLELILDLLMDYFSKLDIFYMCFQSTLTRS
jgi:hypothetical protein